MLIVGRHLEILFYCRIIGREIRQPPSDVQAFAVFYGAALFVRLPPAMISSLRRRRRNETGQKNQPIQLLLKYTARVPIPFVLYRTVLALINSEIPRKQSIPFLVSCRLSNIQNHPNIKSSTVFFILTAITLRLLLLFLDL